MLTRWNDIDRLFGSMDLLRSRMNRLFADFDRSWGLDQGQGWLETANWPRTNVYDTGDTLEVRAEVPGLAADDLNINIQGNYLEISGNRKSDAPEGYSAHRVERGDASFSRCFTLTTEVDVDKAEASLKDGILTLSLPKAENVKPRQIAINS